MGGATDPTIAANYNLNRLPGADDVVGISNINNNNGPVFTNSTQNQTWGGIVDTNNLNFQQTFVVTITGGATLTLAPKAKAGQTFDGAMRTGSSIKIASSSTLSLSSGTGGSATLALNETGSILNSGTGAGTVNISGGASILVLADGTADNSFYGTVNIGTSTSTGSVTFQGASTKLTGLAYGDWNVNAKGTLNFNSPSAASYGTKDSNPTGEHHAIYSYGTVNFNQPNNAAWWVNEAYPLVVEGGTTTFEENSQVDFTNATNNFGYGVDVYGAGGTTGTVVVKDGSTLKNTKANSYVIRLDLGLLDFKTLLASGTATVTLTGDAGMFLNGGTCKVGDAAGSWLTVNCSNCYVNNSTIEVHVQGGATYGFDQIACTGTFKLGTDSQSAPTLSVIEDLSVSGAAFNVFSYANTTGSTRTDFATFSWGGLGVTMTHSLGGSNYTLSA